MRLESLGIQALEVDQHDVEAVLESVSVVAEACGVPVRGKALREELERRLEIVKKAVAEAPRPSDRC